MSPPVDFKIGHYISSVAFPVIIQKRRDFSGECGLIILNSLNTHWLHLPEVPEIRDASIFQTHSGGPNEGFHCTCTYATVLFCSVSPCISVFHLYTLNTHQVNRVLRLLESPYSPPGDTAGADEKTGECLCSHSRQL